MEGGRGAVREPGVRFVPERRRTCRDRDLGTAAGRSFRRRREEAEDQADHAAAHGQGQRAARLRDEHPE
ncbi:MAG: hypothetical protein M3Q22_12620, partial [Actinomycetota bacterium]|nr:hypothetical protein [Actinomycetota bacterium]